MDFCHVGHIYYIHMCHFIFSIICKSYIYLVLDLPHTFATYAYNGKEQFSWPTHGSINELSNHQSTVAKSGLVCFCWGLFLWPVKHFQRCGCPMNVSGWLVQAVSLLEITTQLVDHTGHVLPILIILVTFWVQWNLSLGHTYPLENSCVPL